MQGFKKLNAYFIISNLQAIYKSTQTKGNTQGKFLHLCQAIKFISR